MPRLKINPIVKTSHYQFYFDVCRTTAWRMFKADKQELKKRRMTFGDFFLLYGGFPCPKFAAKQSV